MSSSSAQMQKSRFPWSSGEFYILPGINYFLSLRMLPWRYPEHCRIVLGEYFSWEKALAFVAALPLLLDANLYMGPTLLPPTPRADDKASLWLKLQPNGGFAESELVPLLDRTTIVVNTLKKGIFADIKSRRHSPHSIWALGILRSAWHFLLAALLDSQLSLPITTRLLELFLTVYQLVGLYRCVGRPVLPVFAACLSYEVVAKIIFNYCYNYCNYDIILHRASALKSPPPLSKMHKVLDFPTGDTPTNLAALLDGVDELLSILKPFSRSRFISLLTLLAAAPDCPEPVLAAIKNLHCKRPREVAELHDPATPPERIFKILTRKPKAYGDAAPWYYAAALSHPNVPQEAKLDLLLTIGMNINAYPALSGILRG